MAGSGWPVEIYSHLRILLSLILGLGITRILTGLSRLIQNPSIRPATGAHVVWSLILLLNAVHVWWFEFALRDLPVWHFGIYIVVLLNAFVLFLLASLLFPDVSHDHSGSEGYFMERHAWFFGLFALAFLLDIADTWIKGPEYFTHLGPEYLIRAGIAVTVAILATFARTPRALMILGLIWLAYDISWILRLYNVL